MANLKINNINKNFGSTEVLKGINLDINDGDFLVLLGPSGCGKSTLLNTIAGLETSNSGEILIDNHVVNNMEPSDRDIALVFQSYALYPAMTVRKNVTFGLEQRKTPKEKISEALNEVSNLLQINELLERKPSQLSGGQRQRVAMGRALVRHQEVFLFDEHLSNLDAKLRVEMRREIKKLHKRLKTTIVYVTHDQTEAMSLGTNIAIMDQGKIQQCDTPKNIYNKPQNMFVADFIGSPSMNLLEGSLNNRMFKPNGSDNVQIPLEKYDFDLQFEDRNRGKNNTVFLEPVAIKNGYWGFHGGRELRQLFMMQVQSKGYKFMTSFAMRDVIDERKENDKNVVFVKKFDPERWDYFRVTL